MDNSLLKTLPSPLHFQTEKIGFNKDLEVFGCDHKSSNNYRSYLVMVRCRCSRCKGNSSLQRIVDYNNLESVYHIDVVWETLIKQINREFDVYHHPENDLNKKF